MLGAGAWLGEVGIGVLDARVGLAMGELVGEAVMGFAGTGRIRAGRVGSGVFRRAFARVGVRVLPGRFGHA